MTQGRHDLRIVLFDGPFILNNSTQQYKMKEKFDHIEVESVFITESLEIPHEQMVTIFYTNQKNKEKEWTFFINLN